ncbi:hypothetical protein N7457_007895 [Penicillium paradoxum]|uniref:uncharacterized protein n=1 Tax=Penicillium paradoxum TaxID=176176 RepID=UPI0025497A33|nr:uncharacterized protein N7457_007895 [Penicillium paradoxum]KAJ5772999.1 hypothetical protein N7457_007895 [Penicillium paradoxum]
MPQRRRRSFMNSYTRGYTPQMREAIKCCVCKRRRPKSQYSNNQLNYLRQAMFEIGYSHVHNQSVAKCGPCANAQVCEEMCHRCGHYRAIDQFARNQRSRESPICQPCMNYQLSLDPNDQPLAIEAAHDEDEDEEPNAGSITYSDSGSMSQLEGQSSYGILMLSLTTKWSVNGSSENALVLRDDSAGLEITGNTSGFARVKAHRSHQTPVPEPEPAPGWAPGTRKADDGKPFRGARFL